MRARREVRDAWSGSRGGEGFGLLREGNYGLRGEVLLGGGQLWLKRGELW